MFRITIIFSISIFLFTGCTKSEISSNDDQKTIEVIAKADFDFWETVKLGAEAAGKEFGLDVEFKTASNEEDVEGQIDMVNDAIDKKVNAIVLAASDYEKLASVSERAIDAGIPVIVIDSALDSKKISSFIATDNKEAGRIAAQKLIALTGEKCNVVIMDFVKGAASSDEREEGLLDVIESHAGIKVLDTEYSSSDDKIAAELTTKILSKYNNVDAIVALNSQSTIGVANAIERMKLDGKVKIIGFDSNVDEIGLIEDGVIQATIVQNPYSMGYLGVKTAMDVLSNRKVDKYINTGSTIITKDNIYTHENQKLLFPFIN